MPKSTIPHIILIAQGKLKIFWSDMNTHSKPYDWDFISEKLPQPLRITLYQMYLHKVISKSH